MNTRRHPRIHFIHVGGMGNKGTQALFKTDVLLLQNLFKGEVAMSASTTDYSGVRKLNLPLEAIIPPMVDVPYERADQLARRYGVKRASLRYKVLMLSTLISMCLQVSLSLLSVIAVRFGLPAPYRKNVIECLMNCDLVISHSDESFKETASLLPLNPYWAATWWTMLTARTFDVLVSKSLNRSVILFPNSVGPFRTKIGRFLSRLALNSFSHLLIRDEISWEILNELAITSPKTLTYDTALLFHSQHPVQSGLTKPIVAVAPGVYSHSLSKNEVERYVDAHAKALDVVAERHQVSILLLPHYVSGFRFDDLWICQQIMSRMKHPEHAKLHSAETVEEYKSLFDQVDMIISSKMHPAVLGASGFVPILCIVYDHKQTSFFERLTMAECTIAIRQVTYSKLLDTIEKVWRNRDRLEASLRTQIPLWQKHVKQTITRTLASFLEEREQETVGD
ncbi:MAG: polysaccharide pyruvyl transferase family protein [Candidatus Bathyarchaeota archaeon]|nr:MAG: polysaccharide pyruvyl transferase family protein [Candidatus Bathyarchaeota archaeon]